MLPKKPKSMVINGRGVMELVLATDVLAVAAMRETARGQVVLNTSRSWHH